MPIERMPCRVCGVDGNTVAMTFPDLCLACAIAQNSQPDARDEELAALREQLAEAELAINSIRAAADLHETMQPSAVALHVGELLLAKAQYFKALAAATGRVKAREGALRNLLYLIQEFTHLPESARNGIGEWGVDQGEHYASEMINEARALAALDAKD